MASACAPALFVPPAGPGEPAPEAASAWAQASAVCRTAPSYTGTIRVSGKVGPDHLPTTITILTGATPTAIDLEGRAAGRNIFHLAGTTGDATLYLDDGHRYATGRADALTDALIGIKLGPDRWLALLSGCVATTPEFQSGVRYGPELAITTPATRMYLEQVNGIWRTIDGTFDGLVVTYRQFTSSSAGPAALPVVWSLASEAGRDPSVSLSIHVDSATVGRALPASAFTVSLPADATRISLDELRQSGPLRQKGGVS